MMSAYAGASRKQEQTPELTNQNYPGMYVSILAYCGTDILPKKTVPADNVLVAYCFYCGNGYFTCSNHCISGEDCDPQSGISNRIPAARFEEWGKCNRPRQFSDMVLSAQRLRRGVPFSVPDYHPRGYGVSRVPSAWSMYTFAVRRATD